MGFFYELNNNVGSMGFDSFDLQRPGHGQSLVGGLGVFATPVCLAAVCHAGRVCSVVSVPRQLCSCCMQLG
jgi:hypothetical protein